MLRACLLALALVACQHADSAERSAELTAARAETKPAVAPPAPAAPKAAPAEAHSCGCGMTPGSCNGQCGGECGGAAPSLTAPANATWTTLHVTGMHCGGCARRIERALAQLDGVLGVRADFGKAEVAVATTAHTDARRLVESTIDGLGYQVE